MQNIAEGSHISLFIIVELTITGTHVNGLFSAGRCSQLFTLARWSFEVLYILYLGTTTAQCWYASTIRVHFGTFLLDKCLQGCYVPGLLHLWLLLQFLLLICYRVLADPGIFPISNCLLLLFLQVPWLITVYCIEVSTFTESLQHRELKCRVQSTGLTLQFGFVAQTVLFQLFLINSLVDLQKRILRTLRWLFFVLLRLWRDGWPCEITWNHWIHITESDLLFFFHGSGTLTHIFFGHFLNYLGAKLLLGTVLFNWWDFAHGLILYIDYGHRRDWGHVSCKLLVQRCVLTDTCVLIFLLSSPTTWFYMDLLPCLLGIHFCFQLIFFYLLFLHLSLVQLLWLGLLPHLSHCISFGFGLELHQLRFLVLLLLFCSHFMYHSVLLSWLETLRG